MMMTMFLIYFPKSSLLNFYMRFLEKKRENSGRISKWERARKSFKRVREKVNRRHKMQDFFHCQGWKFQQKSFNESCKFLEFLINFLKQFRLNSLIDLILKIEISLQKSDEISHKISTRSRLQRRHTSLLINKISTIPW